MSAHKLLVGLTGSIGMGKSTTAKMFAARGVPVWDADAAVDRAYEVGGAAITPIWVQFPQAVKGGRVDRDALRQIIQVEPDALTKIEAIVHPIVQEDRTFFNSFADGPIIIFDIPLLFETDADKWLDAVIVVTIDPETQAARVLDRPGMNQERLDLVLSRQLPDKEKRARADYVITTDTIENAQAAVDEVLTKLKEKLADA